MFDAFYSVFRISFLVRKYAISEKTLLTITSHTVLKEAEFRVVNTK